MRDDWKPWTFDQTDLSTGPDPDWTPEEREIAAAQMRGDLPSISAYVHGATGYTLDRLQYGSHSIPIDPPVTLKPGKWYTVSVANGKLTVIPAKEP